ncbi:hypothetical protein V6N13_139312 [Hibiscus sabdariffa]
MAPSAAACINKAPALRPGCSQATCQQWKVVKSTEYPRDLAQSSHLMPCHLEHELYSSISIARLPCFSSVKLLISPAKVKPAPWKNFPSFGYLKSVIANHINLPTNPKVERRVALLPDSAFPFLSTARSSPCRQAKLKLKQ